MTGISNANIPHPAGNPLQGRVALVTGSSRGIGKAVAFRLAALGAPVCLCGRDEETLNITANELQPTGARILALRADVTKEKEVLSLVHATEKQLGPISILVNNAGTGTGGFGPIQEKTEAEWDHILNTNLKSVFFVSRAVVPGMIRGPAFFRCSGFPPSRE